MDTKNQRLKTKMVKDETLNEQIHQEKLPYLLSVFDA